MYKFGVVCDRSLPHPNPPALSKGRGQEPPLYKGGWRVKIFAVPIAIDVSMIINDRNLHAIPVARSAEVELVGSAHPAFQFSCQLSTVN